MTDKELGALLFDVVEDLKDEPESVRIEKKGFFKFRYFIECYRPFPAPECQRVAVRNTVTPDSTLNATARASFGARLDAVKKESMVGMLYSRACYKDRVPFAQRPCGYLSQLRCRAWKVAVQF